MFKKRKHYLLGFLFFLYFTSSSAQKKISSPISTAVSQDSRSKSIISAFNFFMEEDDSRSLQVLQESTMKAFFNLQIKSEESLQIALKILEVEVWKKDRQELFNKAKKLNEILGCSSSPKKQELCFELRKSWNENLINLQFYEDTLGKLKKAKDILKEEKKCREADPFLQQVFEKEGAFFDWVLLRKDLEICLNREASDIDYWEQEKIKLFVFGKE